MAVNYLITSTPSGAIHPRNTVVSIDGFAWIGDDPVANMDLSIDFGQTLDAIETFTTREPPGPATLRALDPHP